MCVNGVILMAITSVQADYLFGTKLSVLTFGNNRT